MSEKKKPGRPARRSDVVAVGVDIDAALWARVSLTADSLGISRRRIIEKALREYFESRAVKTLESIKRDVDFYFDV